MLSRAVFPEPARRAAEWPALVAREFDGYRVQLHKEGKARESECDFAFANTECPARSRLTEPVSMLASYSVSSAGALLCPDQATCLIPPTHRFPIRTRTTCRSMTLPFPVFRSLTVR